MSANEPGWVVFRQIDDIAPMPWANGAGMTRELVGWDESAGFGPAGSARWRLSIARLERVGEFSPLPGVDRTFLLVGGSAELSIDGERHRLGHGDVLRFGGDQHVVLESLAAPCHAVNLMVERGSRTDAPQLVHGPVAGARFAVALESTAGAAQFDLLRPGPGSAVLPDDVASLV